MWAACGVAEYRAEVSEIFGGWSPVASLAIPAWVFRQMHLQCDQDLPPPARFRSGNADSEGELEQSSPYPRSPPFRVAEPPSFHLARIAPSF
jgi:hypothetical protein